MLAAVIDAGSVVARPAEDPAPRSDELLVRVHGAGINAADLLQRAGLYPAPPGSPADVPGMEFAGIVEQVGAGVTGWTRGDRVMAVVGGGGQAELCVVHESHALVVPDGIDLTAAGGIPEAFSTAHDALVTQGALAAGDRVLVTGAAGGVGTAAVQLAHAIGAVVVASARDPRHHEALRSLGAQVVTTPDDVGDTGPFDVVLELVGAQSLTVVQRHLARFARVVVIGVGGGGGRAEVDLLGVMTRRWTLTGSTLRSRSVAEKAEVAAAMRRDVVPLLERGKIGPVVQSTVPLAEIEAGYEAFATGGKFGKLVVKPG